MRTARGGAEPEGARWRGRRPGAGPPARRGRRRIWERRRPPLAADGTMRRGEQGEARPRARGGGGDGRFC
uniref:Uncharacterized protein n=1 Tax=Arundo donax TaxID=35708 RepID=A0A0A9F8Y9_ARUDO